MYFQEALPFHSEALGTDLELELTLPHDLPLSQEGSELPLILLFDMQNSSTYAYNLKSIDYLTGVAGQMPGCIVVGIPFKDHAFRFGATKLRDDKVSMQNFSIFLFEELIPKLEGSFPGISARIIIGHSRTGYLCNYLFAAHHEKLDAVIACSGFLGDAGTEEFFGSLPISYFNQRIKPFHYYMSSGDTYVESSYKADNTKIDSLISSHGDIKGFDWSQMINPNANHFTNYTQTVPWALCDLFADYNDILQSRFETEFATTEGRSPIEQYAFDLAKLDIPVAPSMLHINSIASYYYNEQDYATSIDFLNLGIATFPKDPGLLLFRAEVYGEMENLEAKTADLNSYLELMKTVDLNYPGYADELNEWYEAIK